MDSQEVGQIETEFEIIKASVEFFEADEEFNAYDGPDKYSSISTHFTEKYNRISRRFFLGRDALEKIIKETPKESYSDKKLYWIAKTWNDMHILAGDNPSRILNNADPVHLCASIMSILSVAERHFREYIYDNYYNKDTSKTPSGKQRAFDKWLEPLIAEEGQSSEGSYVKLKTGELLYTHAPDYYQWYTKRLEEYQTINNGK